VIATRNRLIGALKHQIENERPGCAEDRNLKGHETKTITCVETNPEVFMFHATWPANPNPSQILKFMVSIPERFDIK
jgi:hypothetical protein